MNELFKRNWWLGVAALIAGLQMVVGVGIWVDKLTPERTVVNGVTVELPGEALLVWGDIVLTAVAALAAASIVVGLYLWSREPSAGRWFIRVGVLPAVMIGVVFFWFPPFWIVSGAAIAVLVRASRPTTEPVPA